MRILHILDHSLPKHSGYVFRTMAILEAQKKLGWHPVLFTTQRQGETDSDQENIDGWQVFRTPVDNSPPWLPPGLNQFAEMQRTKKRLKEVIKEIRPEILHVHSPVLNFFPANQAANLPIVYEIRAFWEDAAVNHGSTSPGSLRYKLSRWLETRAIKKANHVTTICNGLRNDIISRDVNENKVTVIPNAVNTNAFPPIEKPNITLQNQLNLKGKTVLAFIGSFYAYEGLEFLISSLSDIAAKAPNIALLLVGGGPAETAMKKRTQELGLEDRVIFTGRVPHKTVHDYYSVADIMVYPRHSMRLTETVTPLKPLEAMSLKKLVLASDVGGHRELISHGQNGYLFEADNKQNLVDVCLELISKKDIWKNILNQGRDYVVNDRNWTNSVNRYQSIYQELLDR